MQIEENVPIPPEKQPRTAASKTAHRMKVGDSVFCTTYSEVESIRRVLHKLGGHYCTRKQDGGWRIWRIEREKP